MFRKLLFITALLLPGAVFAAGYMTDLGAPEATITQVFTHSGGGVTLFISGAPENPDTCDSPGLVHLKGDLPGHNQMVSAALTAFAAGKKVGLYTVGCEIIPFWGGTQDHPIISNLWVAQ